MKTLLLPAESVEAISRIGTDFNEMVDRLALALSLRLDEDFLNRIRIVAGAGAREPLLVGQLDGKAWLEVRDGQAVVAHRIRPDGVKSVDLDLAFERDPALVGASRMAVTRSGALAEAKRLLLPMLVSRPLMSRTEFEAVRPWTPLLEYSAYKCAVRISELADALRPQIVFELGQQWGGSSPQLNSYWGLIHSAAHMLMIASDPDARPWLTEMADQFIWKTWTPTFLLLRERTTWLGAAAARSAIAFGEPVVEKYLRALAGSQHPMRAFDALFGLSSIALSNVSVAGPILGEIENLREAHAEHGGAFAGYFDMVYRDAIHGLSLGAAGGRGRPDFKELEWRVGSARGMATRPALLCDATSPSRSGRYPGLAMLPFVVSGTHAEHYPKVSASSIGRPVSERDIADAFRRAWSIEPKESHQTIH